MRLRDPGRTTLLITQLPAPVGLCPWPDKVHVLAAGPHHQIRRQGARLSELEAKGYADLVQGRLPHDCANREDWS